MLGFYPYQNPQDLKSFHVPLSWSEEHLFPTTGVGDSEMGTVGREKWVDSCFYASKRSSNGHWGKSVQEETCTPSRGRERERRAGWEAASEWQDLVKTGQIEFPPKLSTLWCWTLCVCVCMCKKKPQSDLKTLPLYQHKSQITTNYT